MKTNLAAFPLDESLDAVIAITLDGTIAYWSKSAEAIFGYTCVVKKETSHGSETV